MDVKKKGIYMCLKKFKKCFPFKGRERAWCGRACGGTRGPAHRAAQSSSVAAAAPPDAKPSYPPTAHPQKDQKHQHVNI